MRLPRTLVAPTPLLTDPPSSATAAAGLIAKREEMDEAREKIEELIAKHQQPRSQTFETENRFAALSDGLIERDSQIDVPLVPSPDPSWTRSRGETLRLASDQCMCCPNVSQVHTSVPLSGLRRRWQRSQESKEENSAE